MKFKLYHALIGISIFTLLITLSAEFYHLDIKIQSLFWDGENWFLKNSQPWKFLYDFGTIPAILIAVTGLIIAILSYIKSNFFKYRKIAFFLAFAMILGPGLTINTLLKDRWGRPRPRQITEFQGNYEYQSFYIPGIPGKGKSFPCGHASMGFFLFTPAFFIRRKTFKVILYIIGISVGLLIGMARIVRGGHFFTDVIWAGYFVFLIDTILYYSLKLHKNIYYTEEVQKKFKKNIKMTVLFSTILILLILLFLLSMPYYKQKHNYLTKNELLLTPIRSISICAKEVPIKFFITDSLNINLEAQGFGFPGSKVRYKYKAETKNDSLDIKIFVLKDGFFNELTTDFNVFLPINKNIKYTLEDQNCEISYENDQIKNLFK